jgi:predicted N-acetyltransferase YhbS
MDIKIRLEEPEDYYAVEELTREAFWAFWLPSQKICEEHLLVNRLRNAQAFVPELDFVAEHDKKIVGHIIYSKSKVVDSEGNETETLAFGPLSVLPEFQGKGIGKQLMLHSFAVAKELGHRAVLIYGHPDYYPRAGFRRASEFGITGSDGSSRDSFMAYELYNGALDGISGRFFTDGAFDNLSEEDALEFDKKFTPKDKYTPDSISILLDLLQPQARKAIEGLDCPSLQMMVTKSEREISDLIGIDEKALETIRSVLHDHNINWGVGSH